MNKYLDIHSRPVLVCEGSIPYNDTSYADSLNAHAGPVGSQKNNTMMVPSL
jgi:hypothetical protein